MNSEQANQMDLVDYLNSIGYLPEKIRGLDYWYSSPFRDEKDPSFKVKRIKMYGSTMALVKAENW